MKNKRLAFLHRRITIRIVASDSVEKSVMPHHLLPPVRYMITHAAIPLGAGKALVFLQNG
jgi:hypothetical protein